MLKQKTIPTPTAQQESAASRRLCVETVDGVCPEPKSVSAASRRLCVETLS
ncbi:hypothetical protein NEILACOT_05722 [Neisseria lactamica ATCC 23970]|uniref:Uncharacterized protein n=1 Tax=Neisseria lactamica ATCC 23970 TaxID=546265 RepID=D0WDT5_NEILA|nr:hypothetical protein NEILACOT_05722 [Neisseria lactamica ATCC 23970]